MLATKPKRNLKTVELENGETAATEKERQERWQRHFCKVAAGVLHDDLDAFELYRGSPGEGFVDFSAQRVWTTLCKLPLHKGCGPDGIPADLLRLGGWKLACCISRVCAVMHLEETWPHQWRGGRQVELYKGKGSTSSCNSFRGLLLADHLSKIPAAILKAECDPHYNREIPEMQFGAVPGRGADMAHQIVDTTFNIASALALSVALLFLDL